VAGLGATGLRSPGLNEDALKNVVTIKDVAKCAGTSFKTVSRVINNDPKVRPETRDKVRHAIQELGYRPNRAARMMRQQKSGVIGFIADQVTTTPQAVDIIRGVQEMAWLKDKQLMLMNVRPDDRSHQHAIEQLLEYRAEGVIYATMYHKPVTIAEELHDIPTVLVNCFDAQRQFPSVVPDEYQAAFEITQRLLERGYRNPVFLNLNPNVVATGLRRDGFLGAVLQPGLKLRDDIVQHGFVQQDGREISISRNLVRQLMLGENVPDAILCGNDAMAMEVYFALAELGLQVGRDIAVASFDNLLPIAQLLRPGLSTMELPHYQMGQWGLKYLLDGRVDPEQALCQCRFIERNSF